MLVSTTLRKQIFPGMQWEPHPAFARSEKSANVASCFTPAMEIVMNIDRRRFLFALVPSIASLTLADRSARADNGNLFALLDDSGNRVQNYRLPSELSTEDLPGIVWSGSDTPDVILVEFFDYNCPFCRKASGELEAIVLKDRNLRLGLVNNAILSIGSIQVAKVQQAVLKLYGPGRAQDFHRDMFLHRGVNDATAALQVVKNLRLDVAAITTAADGDDVTGVLKRQAELAANLGFSTTPSFMIDGVGILGYPGPRTISRIVAAVRSCDKPLC